MTHPQQTTREVLDGKRTKEIELSLLSALAKRVVYDIDTGVFFWLPKFEATRKDKEWNTRYAGKICGSKTVRGYMCARFFFEGLVHNILLHRLAWFVVKDECPGEIVDHINGIKSDNRLLNLRLIDKSGNGHNIKKEYANNKSGYLGVHGKSGSWQAQIKHKGKSLHLGYFKTPQEAHVAYLNKKREIHEFNTL